MGKKTENRESFFARLDFMSPTELSLIRGAYNTAKATHKNQVRKELDADGVPKRYFEHVREAAIIAIDEIGITDAVIIALILLHDVIEDAKPEADITPEDIERDFGSLITRRLLLLSKKRVTDDMPEAERERLKAEYTYRLHHFADLWVLMAKGFDRLHNLRTLCCHGTTIGFIRKQCAETRKDYIPLFAKMETVARGTELHAAALQLRILIHEQLVRCETCLLQMDHSAATVRPVEDDNAFSGDHDRMDDDGAVCTDIASRIEPGRDSAPPSKKYDGPDSDGYDGPDND
jgi:(p)ppGpp synthase/HD superfamily hydrolase